MPLPCCPAGTRRMARLGYPTRYRHSCRSGVRTSLPCDDDRPPRPPADSPSPVPLLPAPAWGCREESPSPPERANKKRAVRRPAAMASPTAAGRAEESPGSKARRRTPLCEPAVGCRSAGPELSPGEAVSRRRTVGLRRERRSPRRGLPSPARYGAAPGRAWLRGPLHPRDRVPHGQRKPPQPYPAPAGAARSVTTPSPTSWQRQQERERRAGGGPEPRRAPPALRRTRTGVASIP